jgi:hypothetical protein
MEPTIYHLDGKEVHMFGDYVAVAWNTRNEERREGGKRTITAVRFDDPYICFIWIHKGQNGGIWEDDTCSVAEGLSLVAAEQVARELARAIAYLRAL